MPSSSCAVVAAAAACSTSGTTVHGAGANLTERPRWTWLLLVEPEDVCWNGTPCLSYDHSRMTPWQPMDGPRFPIIS